MINSKRLFGGVLATAVCTLHPAWADPAATPAVSAPEDLTPRMTLAEFKALSSSQSRNYDRDQDISPRQMLRLLEVCERTGASLGSALATGEMESAHTWNDFVRPTLPSGKLGAATGVWQFMPGTFHRIVRDYGTQLLAATAADPATGREALDLADGPFTDAQVRAIIRSTVEGRRSVEDEELQLLRHNFTVLAFATIYLSKASGATTPEEAYLYHFLGEGMGRRVLALARGEARNTLSVKPAEPEFPDPLDSPDSPLVDQTGGVIAADVTRPLQRRPAPPPGSAVPIRRPLLADTDPGRPTGLTRPAPQIRPVPTIKPVPTIGPLQGLRDWSVEPRFGLATLDARRQPERRRVVLDAPAPVSVEPAVFSPPPPPSAEWGLPADSPTVTGNLGMFYRDGKGQTQPYTWGEFMQNLERRIRAHDQPAMVRAKYGVGFGLAGGDMGAWAFDPDKVVEPARYRDERGFVVELPPMRLLGTLDADELRAYKAALAALVERGEGRPLDTLPADALQALRHLTALPASVQEGCSVRDPAVQKALQEFRRLTGKEAPDDPEHASRLMPAERVALQVYDQRFSRYAALQSSQQVALRDAPDLAQIMKMPSGLQRFTSVEVAALQTALAERGLLARPTQKTVWRDKKRKKHIKLETLPFSGKVDKATLTALNTFQWRQGLVQTKGAMDALTLGLLGLPAMGPEIFEPLKGPVCDVPMLAQTEPEFSPFDLAWPNPSLRLFAEHPLVTPCEQSEAEDPATCHSALALALAARPLDLDPVQPPRCGPELAEGAGPVCTPLDADQLGTVARIGRYPSLIIGCESADLQSPATCRSPVATALALSSEPTGSPSTSLE